MMKTPIFWKNNNVISFCLYPISIIYSFFRKMHVAFSKECKTTSNVICIGNIIAGGSGKTPVAIRIGEILKEKNINFAYLSKGYKGVLRDFTKVYIEKHTSNQVGDEPLILANYADTFICYNRKKAFNILAKNYNYDVIVMDDGFQNPTIFKDKNIIVIDGEYGIGNGKLLPSGPMRETLDDVVKRATFFIIIGEDKQNLEKKLLEYNAKVIHANIIEKNKSNNNESYIAFCGIGRPQKFFNSLKKSNYNVIKEISFSDHCKYTENNILKLISESKQLNAKLITTKKDWVKIPDCYKKNIEVLDIYIDFCNINEFMELLFK